MQRRHALTLLGRSAAALALGSLFGPAVAPMAAERPAFTEFPFLLGVASGMPRPGSVVLWTRLAPRPYEPGGGLPKAPLPVRWELADDERFSRIRARGRVDARPEHAHSVHVEVKGLPAGREFFYRFTSGEAVSAVGRTRTAPPPDAPVERLRLALASCQHYEHGHYAAHREIAQRDLDLVLFVGDYIYESSKPRHIVRPHEGRVPVTLDGYRRRHAHYRLDPDLQAAHAAHPWLLTWDDHEVQNDYAGDSTSWAITAEKFLRIRAAAYKAYFEHLPVAPSMAPSGPQMRIHDCFTWGRLAELWLLDGRQYRSPQACPADGRGGGRMVLDCQELAAGERTLFGHGQEAWLREGLRASTRRWKLLAQGSQLSPSAFETPLGQIVYTDAWDGYPAARERLLDAIAGVPDVLVLGGDVHRHVAADLRLRPGERRSPVVATEFVASSISSVGLPESALAVLRRMHPDLAHLRGDERGYAFVELGENFALCDFRGTAHPVAAGARLHSQARFAVESGRAGVLRDA